MNITTATPVEIDTRIAAILFRRVEIEHGLMRAQYVLDNKYASAEGTAKAEAEIKAFNAERDELITERETLDDEYRGRGTWTRYFLVTNANGHVHTSTECETCFDDTDFDWLTQFSGTKQNEMGKLSGEAACARCFPNLPAEVMQAKRDDRIDTPKRIAEREERDATKTARDAKKAAKAAKDAAEAITNPDGTPLMDSIDWVVKSETKARSLYVEAAATALLAAEPESNYQGPQSDEEHADRCAQAQAYEQGYADRYLAALANKAGVTTDEMAAELAKKVQAKYRSFRKDALAAKARNN